MIAIRAAIEARGEAETRRVVLVPDSAHGTNPATAALLGFTVRAVAADKDGTVRAEAVREALGPDVAAMMLTNPNTCGLFEPEIVEIAAAAARGGRLSLLRRREFQRHRRQGPPRRSRRRCHAHQPAQDVLHAAWRRRSGRRAGRVLGKRLRPSRRCRLITQGRRRASCWSRTRKPRARRQAVRPAGRVPRPDGHVRARARPTC